MKASRLIKELEKLVKQYGDKEIEVRNEAGDRSYCNGMTVVDSGKKDQDFLLDS